ncbi:cyclic nucleotide-binding domain-containing protein [Actinomadura sp. GC306]|uniref:cyclic nucleotide-binding domain-containing protein n=1 Tax=Actinomadura sp. GC306 TaxID=2530367 RepID=UPI00140441B5|nr:cyclic nucleotide-binding domain-containing protein [Actinomadura sp. GC306]
MRTTTVEELGREPFLRGMRGADLGRLATAARPARFEAGRRIVSEGAPAERFWLVRRGVVAVDLWLPELGRTVIDTLGPGSVLGWSWLFRPHEWRCGAVASTPVEAVEFDGRLVRTLCAVDPSFGYELTRRFAEVMADRLDAVERARWTSLTSSSST